MRIARASLTKGPAAAGLVNSETGLDGGEYRVRDLDMDWCDTSGNSRGMTDAAIILGASVVTALIGTAWAVIVFGSSAIVVVLMALAPLVILAVYLTALCAWRSRRALFDARDPTVLRVRVRLYAAMLRAAVGSDGRVPVEAEAILVTLRDQLGISWREHNIVLAADEDCSRDMIVAYRLGLKGAALDSKLEDAEEFDRLREGFGIPERDQELGRIGVRARGDDMAEGVLLRGRYLVLRCLGEGGFGSVWLARDERLGRDVALKRLTDRERCDARVLRRAEREARAASLLDHPHVVAIHDVQTFSGETYLVMEHMQGGSLADALRERRRLPEDEVVRIGLEVLSALGALHARGIVHRDVKPANILIDGEGRAKLADFTLAHEFVSGDTVGRDGGRGPVGTFAYMPPEQARGLTVRPQADMYALAATMYEALAGEPMRRLDGLSHEEAVRRIAHEMPALPVPHASALVNAALARALYRSPENRFPDASSMAAALREVSSPFAVSTPAGIREGSSPPPRHRLA